MILPPVFHNGKFTAHRPRHHLFNVNRLIPSSETRINRRFRNPTKKPQLNPHTAFPQPAKLHTEQ